MYLHIMENCDHSRKFINFINNNFPSEEHVFLFIGDTVLKTVDLINDRNIININNKKQTIKMFSLLSHSEKIILHGLFLKKVVILLFIQPWLLKKCKWVVWGGDLYSYTNKRKTIKSNIFELLRKKVIKNMGGLITHIIGDYELAQKWYHTKGKHHYSFMYPSNLFKKYDLSRIEKESNKKYIQIGNSADPTNNHLDIFEKLKDYRNENIEIICPLSYGGNSKYKDIVIKEGQGIFGEKFTPLIEFIPFEKYIEMLARIDIAIFNHKRQQAVGNITTLLSLGKKVYIRDDISTWRFCVDHGFKVYSTNNDIFSIFEPIPQEIKKNNYDIMKKKFSEDKLISDWKRIFKGE